MGGHFVNGENSVENQEKMLAREKLEKKKEKTKAKYAAIAAIKAQDSDSNSQQNQEMVGDIESEAEHFNSEDQSDADHKN